MKQRTPRRARRVKRPVGSSLSAGRGWRAAGNHTGDRLALPSFCPPTSRKRT